jgi:hypothetical protein
MNDSPAGKFERTKGWMKNLASRLRRGRRRKQVTDSFALYPPTGVYAKVVSDVRSSRRPLRSTLRAAAFPWHCPPGQVCERNPAPRLALSLSEGTAQGATCLTCFACTPLQRNIRNKLRYRYNAPNG